MNISNVHSTIQILLSGDPQGSILGLLFFNIFTNDLFYFIKDVQPLNFVDNNTITTFSNNVDELITDLQKESKDAVDWFCSNEMIVNPDKFQSITVNRLGKLRTSYQFPNDNHKIDSKNCVTLLNIEKYKLNFEKHITALCKKDGLQLNALSRIHKDIGFQEMECYLTVYILKF